MGCQELHYFCNAFTPDRIGCDTRARARSATALTGSTPRGSCAVQPSASLIRLAKKMLPAKNTATTKERHAEARRTRLERTSIDDACFISFRCLRKKVPFLLRANAVFPHPSPMSSMLMRWRCRYARAEREPFFAGGMSLLSSHHQL